jgi:hypothetical protein
MVGRFFPHECRRILQATYVLGWLIFAKRKAPAGFKKSHFDVIDENMGKG